MTESTTPIATPPPDRRRPAAWALWPGLVAVVVAVFLLNVAMGSVRIPLAELMRALLGDAGTSVVTHNIVWNFRLPAALTALLCGASLGASGLLMQTLFRNPLAGPYVLGISSGASLGVALVALGGFGGWLGGVGTVGGGFLGAGLVLLSVTLVARRVADAMTLLILGLLFSYAAGAVVMLLFHFSPPDRIMGYLQWSFGGFGSVDWPRMRVMAPAVLLGLGLAALLVKPLNALLLGEVYAHSLGQNVRRTRLWIILATALMAGSVTAYCGPIGFIGIAIPHLARGLFRTADHRKLVPAVCLLGAVAALGADLVARLLDGLPLNAVASLLGAPVVAWVILRRRHIRESFG